MKYKELLIAIEEKTNEIKEEIKLKISEQLGQIIYVSMFSDKITIIKGAYGDREIDVEFKIVKQLKELSILKVEGITVEELVLCSKIINEILEG